VFNDLCGPVGTIKPSPTLAVSNLASQLRARGRDVVVPGVDKPDFDTQQPIRDAAIEIVHNGYTHYTAVDDMLSLKQAIINEFERDEAVFCGNRQSLIIRARHCSRLIVKPSFRHPVGYPVPTQRMVSSLI